MKTILDTTAFVTGAFCLWKDPLNLISDAVSFGESARKNGVLRGILDATSNGYPSHTDTVLIKDNGLIETRGMSWPKDAQGRYYYEQSMGNDDALKHLDALAVWPELHLHSILQVKVAEWLHGQDSMGYVYGIENLIRDLENKPTDPKRPVCAMFAGYLLEYMSFLSVNPAFDALNLTPFYIPENWVQLNEEGCDDQLQWFKAQGWIVPHVKQVTL